MVLRNTIQTYKETFKLKAKNMKLWDIFKRLVVKSKTILKTIIKTSLANIFQINSKLLTKICKLIKLLIKTKVNHINLM